MQGMASRLVALIDLIALDTMLLELKIFLDSVVGAYDPSEWNQVSRWIDELTYI